MRQPFRDLREGAVGVQPRRDAVRLARLRQLHGSGRRPVREGARRRPARRQRQHVRRRERVARAVRVHRRLDLGPADFPDFGNITLEEYDTTQDFARPWLPVAEVCAAASGWHVTASPESLGARDEYRPEMQLYGRARFQHAPLFSHGAMSEIPNLRRICCVNAWLLSRRPNLTL